MVDRKQLLRIITIIENNKGIAMNNKQLEIMSMRINPTLKLAMIAMIEWPTANRKELALKMNMDDTQLTATSRRLVDAGLIEKRRVADSVSVMYKVLA